MSFKYKVVSLFKDSFFLLFSINQQSSFGEERNREVLLTVRSVFSLHFTVKDLQQSQHICKELWFTKGMREWKIMFSLDFISSGSSGAGKQKKFSANLLQKKPVWFSFLPLFIPLNSKSKILPRTKQINDYPSCQYEGLLFNGHKLMADLLKG